MKKKLSLIVICCLAVSTLFACGGSKSNSSTEAVSSNGVNKKDSSQKITGFTFDLPDSFVPDNSKAGFYVADDESGANIQYYTLPFSESVYDCDADGMKAAMEAQLLEMGYEIEVTVDSFETITIDGFTSHKIVFSYEHGTTKFKQIQIVAITPELVGNIIYTDINDSGWMDEFEGLISSIHVAYETTE